MATVLIAYFLSSVAHGVIFATGAIRELRRDAVFMADERDRETARVDSERLESQRKFYSELQRQEADMRSGGQGGMNPHLKKKAGKRSK